MHHFRLQAQRELLEATQWYLEDAGPAVAEPFEWAVPSDRPDPLNRQD